MSTMRTKIIRRLTRLAVRQVVRVDRAIAGRMKGVPSRVPKHPQLARIIERRKNYLGQKRRTGSIFRPKRIPA